MQWYGRPAELEIERRLEVERAKAVRKYGPEAVLPGGRPDLDVLDYTINELVGLIRYGEMITARWPRRHVGRTITAAAKGLAITTIMLWLRLKWKGELVGAPESPADLSDSGLKKDT